MMRGTLRTIVTAAASFAVVLAAGGVAAATSGHRSHNAPTPRTTVTAGDRQRGKGDGPARALDATSTTASSETSSTLDDDTSTTIVDDTSTTLGDNNSTTTTVVGNEPGDDNEGPGHDRGEANEEGHENENAELHEHEDEATTTTLGNAGTQPSGDHRGDAGSSDHSGRDGGGHDGSD